MQPNRSSAPPAPGRAQGLISLAVLLVLVMAVVWVWSQQSRFNPAVKVLVAQGQQKGAPAQAGLDLAAYAPAGLKPLAQAERYNPQNLFHKINGKADLYLRAGFVSLTCRRFGLGSASEPWLEVLAYDLGGPEGAFAVYAQQRRAEAQPLDWAPWVYQTSNALFLARDRYYVEIVASAPQAQLMQAAREWAKGFVSRNPPLKLPALDRFPAQGLVAHSQGLLMSDAFGFAGLNQVYVARYTLSGGTGIGFFSPRQGTEPAAKLAGDLIKFLTENGGKEQKQTALAGARLFEFLGSYELVAAQGALMWGVHEAPSPEAALELGGRLAKALGEKKKP